MLSWEYPPKNVGGLSNHVYFLSRTLAEKGHDIHVITCDENNIASEDEIDGVTIHRISPYNISTDDFVKQIMHLNFTMVEAGVRVVKKFGKFDVIHAHDWLTAYSARALKWIFHIPMVSTIHATEFGRNGGLRTEMQKYISSVEDMLSTESWKVIVCSDYMRRQVNDIFKTQWEKIWVIPNGVNMEAFNFEFDWLEFRRKYAMDDEKIVLYVGRHVYEKGIHLLIEAAQGILRGYNRTKFIIVGRGPMTEELKNRVRELGIENKFLFTGYMKDEDKNKLYKVASIAVFPSIYEPFGIVALEAMAAGCPVVVSNTGGLDEIIEDRYNGLKSETGSALSLESKIVELLNNNELWSSIRENGIKTVSEGYTWINVADTTINMYELIKEESRNTPWYVSEEDKLLVDDKVKSIQLELEKNKDLIEKIYQEQNELDVKRKEIESINEDVKNKGEELRIHLNDINNRDKDLKERDSSIELRLIDLTSREEDLKIKLEELNEKLCSIEDKEMNIARKEEEFKITEKELKSREREVKKKEKEIKQLQKKIKEEMDAQDIFSVEEKSAVLEKLAQDKPKRTRKTSKKKAEASEYEK